MLKVEFNADGIFAQLTKITGDAGASLRPAAQAAAQVFYDEVRLQAPQSEKAHFTKGKRQSYQPGNLKAAIYQAYNRRDSVAGKFEGYGVSWNKKKAFYGHFVENGTSRSPAYSFLRKSYESQKTAAAKAAEAVFAKTFRGLNDR